jgi:RNA polymerase sigma-70 factor (ECF subfamily)
MPFQNSAELPAKPSEANATTLSDNEIVERILAGDQPLYELLMRRYNRLLFRIARSILREDDEARDVVQATHVLAYYHLAQFRGPTGFGSWLARIAINEASARARRLSTGRDCIDDDVLLHLPEIETAEPENIAIGGETLRVVEAAIDKLPDEFRTVFMLRGVEQLSIAETAMVLDIKPATVKTRFHRARRLLQAALQRSADEAANGSFGFAGQHCDRIVAAVFGALKGDR